MGRLMQNYKTKQFSVNLPKVMVDGLGWEKDQNVDFKFHVANDGMTRGMFMYLGVQTKKKKKNKNKNTSKPEPKSIEKQ